MNKNKFLIIFILFFLITINVYSQLNSGKIIIKNFYPKDFNGKSQVWCALQDNDGIMYFGNTQTGILEFDSVTWKNIQISNYSTVRSMDIDNKGNIYVGGIGEFGYLEIDKFGNKKYISLLNYLSDNEKNVKDIWNTYSTANGVYFFSLKKIYRWYKNKITIIRSNGNDFFGARKVNDQIYVRMNNIGIVKITGNQTILIPDGDYFKDKYLRLALPYDNNSILFGSYEKGLYIYNNNNFIEFKTEIDELIKKNTISNGVILPNGNFAFFSKNIGILIIDKKGKLILKIDNSDGLISNNVYNLFIDNQNGFWAVTRNGISYIYYPSSFKIYNKKSGISGITTKIIRKNNKLYILGLDGLFTEKNNKFIKIDNIKSYPHDIISFKKTILVGTSNGIVQIKNNNFSMIKGPHQLYSVYNLILSTKFNNIMFAAMKNGIGIFEYKNNKWMYKYNISNISEYCYQIIEDKNKNLWINTRNNLININFKKTINNYDVKKYDNKNGIPAGEKGLYFYNNEIIISCYDGIYKLNNSKFIKDSKYKLNDITNINSLYFHNKDIWICSGIINEIDILKKNKNVYENSNNYTFKFLKEYSINYIYFDNNNIIWFCSPNGIIKYDPTIKFSSSINYKPIIRKFIVNKKIIFGDYKKLSKYLSKEEKHLIFKHTDNNIKIEYAYCDYKYISGNKYRIKLDGIDKDWGEWTGETYVNYKNLKDGKFKLKLQAKNIFGYVTEINEFNFQILPPFYKTIYAYIIYILIFIIFIILILFIQSKFYKMNTIKKLARYDLLLSKINSHFLFNTLNSIISLIGINAEKAEKMVEKLSSFLRYITQFEASNTISIKDELKIVESYLFIQSIRFQERLNWEIDIDDDIKNIKIPQFLLQPIVENSIKYNIAQSLNGGIIKISIKKYDLKNILIKINDKKFENKNQSNYSVDEYKGIGIGLENIKERLKLVYGKNIKIEGIIGNNTYKTTILLPIKNI